MDSTPEAAPGAGTAPARTSTPHKAGTRQKAGLVLAGLLSLSGIPSVFTPTPDGEVGPPFTVLLLGTLLGLVGLGAVVVAWSGRRPAALRIAAGALIVAALTAVPAFFVDVPAWVRLAAGVSVLLTVAAVVLMFSTDRGAHRGERS